MHARANLSWSKDSEIMGPIKIKRVQIAINCTKNHVLLVVNDIHGSISWLFRQHTAGSTRSAPNSPPV